MNGFVCMMHDFRFFTWRRYIYTVVVNNKTKQQSSFWICESSGFHFVVMWICIGMTHPSCRLTMDSTKYYSGYDLFNKCKQCKWPAVSVFLEFDSNAFIKVTNESELVFTCELVSRAHVQTCNIDIPVSNTFPYKRLTVTDESSTGMLGVKLPIQYFGKGDCTEETKM